MIYLDYHATTPVDLRVADRVYHFMTTEFGNASSVDHQWGDRKPLSTQYSDLPPPPRLSFRSTESFWVRV
jgi:hypothetical protein